MILQILYDPCFKLVPINLLILLSIASSIQPVQSCHGNRFIALENGVTDELLNFVKSP